MASKNLKVIKNGKDGLQVKGHFEVDDFGRCDVDVQYKKLASVALQELLLAEYEVLATEYNAAPEITPALLAGLYNRLDAISAKIAGGMVAKGAMPPPAPPKT